MLKQKNYSIQFLRFLFTMLICFAHTITTTYLANFKEYGNISSYIQGSYIVVLFFFVMSGFYMKHSLIKNVEDFVKDRVLRLWPVMAFSIILFAVFKPLHWSENSINALDLATLFFLQGTGVSQDANANGPAWFVCVLFWTSTIYFIYMKIINRKCTQIISIAILVFFTMFVYIYYLPRVPIRGMIHDCFSLMMLSGFAFVGFGILLSFFDDWLNKKFNNKLSFESTTTVFKIIYTIAELILFMVLCVFMLYKSFIPYPYNPLLVVILFCVMFLLFTNKSGYLSSVILNTRIWNFLGRGSYSVYIMQNFVFVFVFVYHYAMLYENFVKENIVLTLLIIMLAYHVAGYIACFLVERAVFKYVKNKGGK